MRNELINQMVDRFLMWKLPETLSPDCGISFKRYSDYDHPQFGRSKNEPTGTNMLNASEAKQMFEHSAVPLLDKLEQYEKRCSESYKREIDATRQLLDLRARVKELERMAELVQSAEGNRTQREWELMIVDLREANEIAVTAMKKESGT